MIKMNAVDPIKDIAVINEILQYLLKQSERNHLLFALGIYTGLRISDYLQLRVIDVKSKDYINVIESKTGKENSIPINEELKPILRRYCSGKREYEYLFKSRRGNNTPISRIQAYRILKLAAREFDIACIGCHTTRKTYGYMLYKLTEDIELVKSCLNHSDSKITARYIGIDKEEKDQAIKKISLKKKMKAD
ncbi:MAG: site-specific integrase [Clostridiaceae bacterium]